MSDNNEIMILDSVERYIRGEMNPDERLHFENLRKANQAIDQLVVEHTLFLQQINQFGEKEKFKATLNDVHTQLAEQGKINSDRLEGKARVIYLWKRYKRVAAIAASIAGITAIGITSLINTLRPVPPDSSTQIGLVRKEIQDIKKVLDDKIDSVDNKTKQLPIIPIIPTPVRFNGTGFLIDAKGLMITNAHVVKNSRNIYVQNKKGEQFRAIVLKLDIPRDVAIIKIDDDRFKPSASLPYGIRRTSSDIAESIFTLGFPRDEMVYGEGYLSAPTGYKGDTLSCQISVAANPGNSGGPVFNSLGEVIGILSTKETHAEGAVFAVKSKYIFNAMDDLKKNKLYENVKLSSKSTISELNAKEKVKKIQDYVFMVKGD